MQSKFEKIAEEILERIGGAANISNCTHCMTRLRFTLKDTSLVKAEEIEALQGVLGIKNAGGQFQVIIGKDVNDVYDCVCKIANIKTTELDITDGEEAGEKKKIGQQILDYISNAFIPLVPALVGSGMLKGFLSLFTYLGWLDATSATYAVLSAAGNAVFYFIPLLIAYNTAKYLKANIVVAMVIMGALMEPNFTALAGAEDPLTLFGLPLTVITYSSMIIPALIIVPIQAQLEKLLKRFIPKSIQLLFVPLITIFVMVVLSVLVIGPASSELSNLIGKASNWLNDTNAVLFGILVGGTVGYLTILGVHMALVPIIMLNFTNMGADPVLAFMSATCYAQIGVAFAIWFRSKDKEVKSLAGASGITALLAGVTEPILFGVCMKYKRSYAVIGIAGALGGMIMGIFGCKAMGFVNAGILGLSGYFSDTFGFYLLAAAVSMVAGFILMAVFGFGKGERKDAAR
ncbi:MULTISPECIES: PTS transporter subunit EIIC [unclassified Roseburia]|uniref:PTS transporter subunit EIIC n=1 Tax=unclassified Roseburia TaxID=2637578 RepID=UPI000E44FF14|nr:MULTISPECIES: PTS transporter subunit EIIC [unclassified Roseburia]RGF46165.1 PTS beta-glucoside transporter subunit EIIBCA [Roseburia sp. AF42-8]RHQ42717.1 PTS beta-glucoside transporter subunit EIIBCA [Roseburia sp. AF25-25LB]RHQ43631.1 PTS beta-glucoside transporter subunit EIIBCA [Roseburia sp. AF25-18LB]RHQ50179.1 PTS beta-glucoside transporter subunit EIIBCA [Roseburia sp. AF25-13LB]RHQ50502.1 PTS beta-glucoside transporter subunit EIIBCA [Roseburia sp. AF25-15LB]